MAYSIGSTSFDDLAGDILLPTPNHDVESRSGQDGVVVFSTGRRGQQFTLESLYVETSYANAQALAITYSGLPSVTPQNIVRGTVDFSSSGIAFVVLGVEARIVPLVSWVGLRGSSSPAFAVYAQWRLQPVEV